jgi:hypothetical protein
MKKIFTVSILLIQCTVCFSQVQFDTHFSIDEIKFYRNLFSQNSVKSATVESEGAKKVYAFDKDGKITEKREIDPANGKTLSTDTYNYDFYQNLISIYYNTPYYKDSVAVELYKYDASGNVIKETLEALTTIYFYDGDNHMQKSEFIEQGTEANPVESVTYNSFNLVTGTKEVCWSTGEGAPNTYGKTEYEFAGSSIIKCTGIVGNCKTNKEDISWRSYYDYGKNNLPVQCTNTSMQSEYVEGYTKTITISYEYY